MEKETHFGPKIKFLSNAFEQTLTQKLATQGLTSAQSYFLHFLSMKEFNGIPVHSKDIAEAFKLKHSTVSGVLQRLEANGFLSFVPDEADHRQKRIVLSEKAREGKLLMKESFEKLEETMLTDFTDDEKNQFYEFLLRAAANIGATLPPEMRKGEIENK